MDLPDQVCFRVTRYCNARCGFCLAPPDGAHPPAALLKQRLTWLAQQGVRTIHFCGGEPTIHPALVDLLMYAHELGLGSRLTTNGIVLPDALLPALRLASTRVRISLHGDAVYHDALVGRPAFAPALQHLRQLLAAGIPCSVQTTLVAGGEWVLDWMVAFCLAEGVRQLNILPFIPRGSGYRTQREYGLTLTQRQQLHAQVRARRHALRPRLDLRWLDFAAKPLPVVEADGRVVLERASEALDTVLGRIPGEHLLLKRVPLYRQAQSVTLTA